MFREINSSFFAFMDIFFLFLKVLELGFQMDDNKKNCAPQKRPKILSTSNCFLHPVSLLISQKSNKPYILFKKEYFKVLKTFGIVNV